MPALIPVGPPNYPGSGLSSAGFGGVLDSWSDGWGDGWDGWGDGWGGRGLLVAGDGMDTGHKQFIGGEDRQWNVLCLF